MMPIIPTATTGRARGVLLTSGDHLGTLAAARDLGRIGVRVLLADADRRSLTARSRYAEHLASPPIDRADEWLQWLLEFGRREPGHVLLPTSDDVCWMLDTHRAELAASFRLYQPPAGAVWQLLNKQNLHAHCREAGLDQPEQWGATAALQQAADLPYPVIVKPCTQAGMRVQAKGTLARDAAELAGAIRTLRSRNGWRMRMLRHDPTVTEMVVQAFHAGSERGIYSLSGFYSPEADTFLLRASRKVLQQPMRIGIGLCFESSPVDPALAAGLRTLFDRLGYRGAFEAEYLCAADGRSLLIDVNPRFYGQMAFDIARGLHIPRLCWHAAHGRWDEVRRLAASGQRSPADLPTRSCDAWLLRLFATTHLVGRNLSLQEWRGWLDWTQDDDRGADLIAAADDTAPALQLRRRVGEDFLRRPRSTWRKFFVR